MIALFFIIIGTFARLLPHEPNVAPIAAMALFGGVYLDRRVALVVPLLAMILSDLILGFHATMPYVYGSFVLTGLLGMGLRGTRLRQGFGGQGRGIREIVMVSLLSSVLFFLITNFGVWASGMLYPKTIAGLMESYLMGLPFFRNTVFGDLLYTSLFFGGYEIVQAYVFRPLFTMVTKR